MFFDSCRCSAAARQEPESHPLRVVSNGSCPRQEIARGLDCSCWGSAAEGLVPVYEEDY